MTPHYEGKAFSAAVRAAGGISCASISSEFVTMIAPTIVPDIIFHPGELETRFTPKGMVYRGELVEDAGAAHAILMQVLGGRRQLPPPVSPSSGKVHPSVWADPVLNLMREARDTMVDFGPRGTQFEVIADIDRILEQGVTPSREPELQVEIKRLTTMAKQNNDDADMYARAWQREMAGYLFPKGHHIDMMTVSTQKLIERCRAAEKRVKAQEKGAPVEDVAAIGDAAQPEHSAATFTTLTPLAILIDQLEAAEHPDPGLDMLIAMEMGCNIDYAPLPRYTQSFEAALTLIEPGKDYQMDCFGSGPNGATFICVAMKWWPRPDDKKDWRSESGNKLSPALALCIAALKVRLARSEEGGPGVKRSAA
ncbi:hypothetical protein [Massilia sp. TSP1-1-2]|uniref:hypothetical protein n=1 Tax=Massilia sp. TSP1-1-2 TaxID=2804649 RepID=UPI003CF3AED7